MNKEGSRSGKERTNVRRSGKGFGYVNKWESTMVIAGVRVQLGRFDYRSQAKAAENVAKRIREALEQHQLRTNEGAHELTR